MAEREQNPVEVSTAILADSINRRTAGIRQLSGVLDLVRLKRQAALNQRLVRKHQDLTYGKDAEGDNVAGSDDNISIGDQFITINQPGGTAAAGETSGSTGTTAPVTPTPVTPTVPAPTPATPVNPAVPQTPNYFPGGLLIPGQNTPIVINPAPAPAPAPAATPTAPTNGAVPVSKLWPIVGSALLGSALGAGAVGYALKPETVTTPGTLYNLEFDRAAADNGIPAPTRPTTAAPAGPNAGG